MNDIMARHRRHVCLCEKEIEELKNKTIYAHRLHAAQPACGLHGND